MREAMDQAFADDKSKNGVAQKLHLLVIGEQWTFRAALGCQRFVGQGADQQFPIAEAMADPLLEYLQIRRVRKLHHFGAIFLRLSP